MGLLSQGVRDVSSGLVRRLSAAPEQAGIFVGMNPSKYDAGDPIKVWVIQLVIIIAMTQFLALIGSRIRQPRVIAEVIGGVVLGPSVMGHIPGFTRRIFPQESIANLNLTATIGLILFLFLIGLEVDVRLLKRNASSALAISACGLILPLGLGAALAVPIYHNFVDPAVRFGQFVLFVAVAIGITAFPVLCRILTETRLLETHVGTTVLAAGVGDDVVGWILLALTVALVNSNSGITTLWILLTAVGYTIFMLFPVRWAYRWVARRTASLESGKPTTLLMTLTMIMVFSSAFFTDIIGVHAIFGGFIAGLIIPHDNGLAISMVEKIEDLVSVLLLPLYFALSGLRTNLGLLNNGITWGYTILIIVVAFFSKFIGCAFAAKLRGFNIRESSAIGVLMSCKGLVELIVLNVGYSAGILDTRSFSMFVLHAIIVTFITTPLTLWVYPPEHRGRDASPEEKNAGKLEDVFRSRVTMVLDKVEQLPAIMSLTQLLGTTSSVGASLPNSRRKTVSVDALRLMRLTERTSDVFRSQEAASVVNSDSAVSLLRTFGHLNGIPVSAFLHILTPEEFPAQVAQHVSSTSSQLVVLPWSFSSLASEGDAPSSTPFDKLFGRNAHGNEQTAAAAHTHFVRRVFNETPTDVALFVDRGVPEAHSTQHIFLPFLGGQDDRLALSFVVQLCMNSSVSATVVRFRRQASHDITPVASIDKEKAQLAANINPHFITLPDTIYGANDTQTRLASATADEVLWERFTKNYDVEIVDSLRRISFSEQSSSRLLHTVVESATATIAQQGSRSRILVAVGRSRRMAVDLNSAQWFSEKGVSVGSEIQKTLGDVGAAFSLISMNSSLLVLQASNA